MVSTPTEPSGGGWGDQLMMQSDFTQGRTSDLWGRPGPNELHTMAYTWQYIDWPTWVGLIDGVPVLDGFPGYTASAKEIAVWCGDQMESFGLPRQLFVQASIPEMTSIWADDRYSEDISDIPGFSYSVDYDSFGPVQQRWQYYPFPWDFETSLWSFAQMALHPSYCPNPQPHASDADGCAEWIANIQSPAAEYRGRYRRLDDGTDTHAWATDLVSTTTTPPSSPPGPLAPPPEAESDQEMQNLTQATNWFGIRPDGTLERGGRCEAGWIGWDPKNGYLRFIDEKEKHSGS